MIGLNGTPRWDCGIVGSVEAQHDSLNRLNCLDILKLISAWIVLVPTEPIEAAVACQSLRCDSICERIYFYQMDYKETPPDLESLCVKCCPKRFSVSTISAAVK